MKYIFFSVLFSANFKQPEASVKISGVVPKDCPADYTSLLSLHHLPQKAKQ